MISLEMVLKEKKVFISKIGAEIYVLPTLNKHFP